MLCCVLVVLGGLSLATGGGAAGTTTGATGNQRPAATDAATAPMASAVTTTQTCAPLTLNGSVTTEITTANCYVIESDVTNATADPLIRIAADGVTIDGNGHVLDGTGNGTAVLTDPTLSVTEPIVKNLTATDWRDAIVANRSSTAVIRDLTVRDASGIGVGLGDGTTNAVVDNVAVDGARVGGIGVTTTAGSNTIRDVRVTDVPNGPGIRIDGVDNQVTNVSLRETAVGFATVGATGTYGTDVRVERADTGVFVRGGPSAATTDTAVDGITVAESETAFVTETGPTGVRNTNNTFRAFRTADATVFDIEGARNVAISPRSSPPTVESGLATLGPSFDATATAEGAYLAVNVSYDEAAADGFPEQTIRLWRVNDTGATFVEGENAVFKPQNTVAANATTLETLAPVGIADRAVVSPLSVDSGATVTHSLTTAYLNMSGNEQTNTVQAVFDDSVAGNLTLDSVSATDLDGSETFSVRNAEVVDGPDGDGRLDTVTADVSTTRTGRVDTRVDFSVTVAYPSVSSDLTVPVDRRLVDADGTTDVRPWENVTVLAPDGTETVKEPDIDLSTNELGFGPVPVNDSATETLTVTNDGQAGLSVSEVGIDGLDEDRFSVDADAFRLNAGEPRTLTVTFEPVETGAVDATLTVRSDDPDRSRVDVGLDGIGVSSDMTVNRSRLAFDAIPVGATATRSLTVRNDGAANLTVENASVAGENASAFALDRSRLSVPSSAERDLNVTFAPESAGEKTARLSVSGDGGTVDVSLAGTATASPLSAPGSLAFEPTAVDTARTKRVRVENAGSSPVALSVATAGSPAFTAETDSLTLPANGSDRVRVTFGPTAEGPTNGTLVLRGPGRPANVSLTGDGRGPRLAVSPPGVAFGNVSVGSTVGAQLAVENVGGGTLNVTGLSLSGPDTAAFAVESASPSLGPGEQGAVNVSFAPTDAGPRTATLAVGTSAGRETVGLNGTGAAAALSVSPRSLAFGSATAADQVNRTVTVRNGGERPVSLSRLAIRGANASSFAVAGDAPASVPAGAERAVRVRFRPRTSGQATARLVVDANGSAVPTRSVALRGSGAVPDVRVRPSSLSFGSVAVDSAVTRNLTVVNDGTAPLTVEDVALTSGLVGVTEVEAPTTPIDPGARRTIPVTFTPAERRTYSGTLQLVTDDPDEPVVPVWVSNSNTTANLSLEAGRNRTDFSATVSNAERGTEVGFEFGGNETGDGGTELTGVSVRFRENESAGAGATLATRGRLGAGSGTGLGLGQSGSDGVDFTLDATSSASPLAGAPGFRTPTDGTVGLRYVNVTHSFPNSAVENASLTFRVDRERIESLRGTDPEDVVVYRYADGEWVERPTEIVAERDGTLVLRATATGFSDWTVGAEQASFDVVRADVSVTSVATGDSVNVNVRIENTGGADGEFLTELLLNEELVDSREVEIAAGGTAQVTFDRSFGQPGTYSVRVNDVPAGQIQVDTESGGSGGGTAAGTGTSSGSGDAVGPLVAALVVAAAAAVAGRYRSR